MNRRTFLAASAGAGLASAVTSNSPAVSAAARAKRLKVLVPAMPPEQMTELEEVAPGTEFVVPKDPVAEAANADASYGFITPEILRVGRNLRWVQQASAGVENIVFTPEMQASPAILTNMQRIYGPEIADQAIAYLLAFTRSLNQFLRLQPNQEWQPKPPGVVLDELMGKTMLVIGLGGIGSEIARRASAFGMTILATDPKVFEKPSFVAELHRPAKFHELLPKADVVASAVPLTPDSRGMIGEREFGMMKTGAILINVSRGKVVDTGALVRALDSKQIAAAGLDVTDPEPLPKGHALWSRNVIITPHSAGQSPGGERRRHDLFKENLRRFARGEMLLNVVDKKVGY